MRPIWKGSVTFGLVNVPVRMYSATQDHDVSLHQVHAADGGRIRYQRTCSVCGEVVAFEDIARAFETDEGVIMLSDEELDALPVASSKEIEVVEFVPSEQIDPIRFERSYYLEPSAATPKAYILLTQVLEQTERTAIVRMTLRTRTRLAALRTHGPVLVLHTLLWDDEVREPSFPVLDEEVSISKQELSMSQTLVESLSADFEPSAFADDYQVQLRELIAEKAASGGSVVRHAAGKELSTSGDVVDLMEALRRSVEQARAKSAEDGADKESGTEAPAPASTPRRRRKAG